MARRSARAESRNLQEEEESIVQRLRLLADVLATSGGDAPDVIADTFKRSHSDRNLLTKRRSGAAALEEHTTRRSSFRQSMRMQQQQQSPQHRSEQPHQSSSRERQQQQQHHNTSRHGSQRHGSTRRSHRAAPAAPDAKESKPLPLRPAAAEPPIPARQPNPPSAVPHRPYLSNLVVYQNAYNITLGDAAPPDGKPHNGSSSNAPPREPTSPRFEQDFYQNNDSGTPTVFLFKRVQVHGKDKQNLGVCSRTILLQYEVLCSLYCAIIVQYCTVDLSTQGLYSILYNYTVLYTVGSLR